MQTVVIWAMIAIFSGVAGGVIAVLKNRDWSAWCAWGFLVPPSILLLLILPKRGGPPPRRPTLEEEDQKTDFL